MPPGTTRAPAAAAFTTPTIAAVAVLAHFASSGAAATITAIIALTGAAALISTAAGAVAISAAVAAVADASPRPSLATSPAHEAVTSIGPSAGGTALRQREPRPLRSRRQRLGW